MNTDATIRPYESDQDGFWCLIEHLHVTAVIDEFLVNDWDERDRIVGAGLEQGYHVRVTTGTDVRRYIDRDAYDAEPWNETDPALLKRLRGSA